MSIIQNLNNNMPSFLNIEDSDYKKLFGKYPFTSLNPIEKSSDINCGAISNELEFFKQIAEDLSAKGEVETWDSNVLDVVIPFFIDTLRNLGELDSQYVNRLYFFLRRGGFSVWCSKHSLLGALSHVLILKKENLYIIENYVETNLLQDGSFEVVGNPDWTFYSEGSSVSEVVSGDSFEESNSAKLQIDSSGSLAYCETTVSSIPAGTYTCTLFYKSTDNGSGCYVKRTSDDYYWNTETNDWQSSEYLIPFKQSNVYTLLSFWFVLSSSDSITFGCKSSVPNATSHVDYVFIGERQPYPSFQVLYRSLGQSGEGTLMFHEGSTDPDGTSTYSLLGYYDLSFIEGASGILSVNTIIEMLDRIKLTGTKFEFKVIQSVGG